MIPRKEYKEYTDPGYPKKKIYITETRTEIKGYRTPIRTILLLNEKEKK
jgi:hypothetical protein